ncbi:MAG: 2-phosphosulfolactate phosphatase [Candidatus Kapaibacteriales bacterium]
MLLLKTYLTPNFSFSNQEKNETICVAIDVLRASTSICFALYFGAKDLVPFSDPAEAINFAHQMNALSAGERDNKKIDGFDFGNSPLEFQTDLIQNRTIAFFTTNGTKLFHKCNGFLYSFVAGFVNVNSVATKIVDIVRVEKVNQILIICAGDKNEFSLEDSICSSMLIFELSNRLPDLKLDDASFFLKIFFQNNFNRIKELLFEGKHCRELIQEGLMNDVCISFSIDSLDVVPQIQNFRIKLMK